MSIREDFVRNNNSWYFEEEACVVDIGHGVYDKKRFHGYTFLSALALIAYVVGSYLLWSVSKFRTIEKDKEVGKLIHKSGKLAIIPPFVVSGGLYIANRANDCTQGCASWSSHCYSISCVCANILKEGYVFMFVLLTMVALIIVDRIFALRQSNIRQANYRVFEDACTPRLVGEQLMMVGVVVMMFTGILPAEADDCSLENRELGGCFENVANILHLMIGPGVMLSFTGLLLTIFASRAHKGNVLPGGVGGSPAKSGWCGSVGFTVDTIPGKAKAAKRATVGLLCICLGSMLISVVFLILFLVGNGGRDSNKVDICINYKDAASCTGGTLAAHQLEIAENRTGGWQCIWNEDAPFWLEGSCTRDNCNLDDAVVGNRLRIFNEFIGLLYWIIAIWSGLLAVELLDVNWSNVEVLPGTKCGCSSVPFDDDNDGKIASNKVAPVPPPELSGTQVV